MLFELLTERARQYPDKIAVVGERKSLAYSELHREAGDLALYLSSLSLRPGEAILIGLPPTADFYIAFFAACGLGLLSLPVLPSGLIAAVYQKQKPRAAIGSAEFLSEVRSRCGSDIICIEWTAEGGMVVPKPAGTFHRSAMFRDQPVLGVSSSGTTGDPRLHLRSAALILQRARVRSEVQRLRFGDVFLSSRPFNSGSAINSHVVLPIYLAGRVVVHEKFERFKAAAAIESERVTVLYAVPFIFELLASLPENRQYDFSSLRACVSGSAPLSKFVATKFRERFGIVIRQRYSGSHFHPAFSYNLDGPPESVGRTDGLFPIVILDQGGRAVDTGEIGEIAFDIARMPAQFRQTAERNPNRRGNFLHTGDLGCTDMFGNVFVVGRKSPFIKVGGYRVEPAEVESVLRSHPKVKEALVFALRPGQSDEAVGAMVAAASDLLEQELLSFCRARLDPYKCPRSIEIRDQLPRTEHGKVARRIFESLPVGVFYLSDWAGMDLTV